MPPALKTCLEAYSPEFVCPKCLAYVVEQDETLLARALNELVLAGQVQAGYAMCVECGVEKTVMRAAPAESGAA